MNLIKNMLSLPDLKLNNAEALLKKSLLPILEKNQVVDAKVLKLISPSKAELLILGKKVIADTSESPNLAKANLAKGDTIQLKVTDQGHLNILKVIPEKVISQGVIHSTSVPNSSLSRLSDSALQFFAKNQPFEGFTKLAAALFPNLKESPELTKKEIS
ncbi:MAG: hypothetical protein HQK73_07160, partial [Desulfamplus sp.]|nr:hypothetical protein [Desulfamplus sp.]